MAQQSSVELFGAPFLTAFDPSDLPGISVDPLGFDRAYGFLADQILPGLTNVARQPRYFSLLCAGGELAGVAPGTPERHALERTQGCVLRLERLWVLANLLATKDEEHDSSSTVGIRGINYGRAHLGGLGRETRTSTDFKLLNRQVPYGVIGIYGNVSDGLKLIDRKTLCPSPDLGARLGEAFVEETHMPDSIRAAVIHDGKSVELSVLADWGGTAHIRAAPGREEGKLLREALIRNPTRSRMAELLAAHPRRNSESDLQWIERLLTRHRSRIPEDLRTPLALIIPFEKAYRLSMLTLERVLYLARKSPSGALERTALDSDPILTEICSSHPAAALAFESMATDWAQVKPALPWLRTVSARDFLKEVVTAAARGPSHLALTVVARHCAVQRGKVDKGRPKAPWIDVRGERLELLVASGGQIGGQPEHEQQVPAHDYRLASADGLYGSAGEN